MAGDDPGAADNPAGGHPTLEAGAGLWQNLPLHFEIFFKLFINLKADFEKMQEPGGSAINRPWLRWQFAKVAELVDALDLGSSAARRESSSLSFRTTD